MTHETIGHDAAKESLEALALDALDAGERDAVMAHVDHCGECRTELAALRAATSGLAYAVRPVELSQVKRDRIRARLLARATTDLDERMTMSPEPTLTPKYEVLIPTYPQVERRAANLTRHWMTSTASWIAMAATIVAVASITSLMQVSAERDKLAAQSSGLPDRVGPTLAESLQTMIGEKNRMIANLTGSQVAVVSLASSSAPSPNGRMFWDQSVNQWTFVGHNLPRPRAGRTYQIWLITPSQKISAGTFIPDPNGDVMMQMRYSLPKDALTSVAVTEEPVEGSTQPTATPYIAGQRVAVR